MVKVLNIDNFENEVINASEITLVDFYADWCGPCKMMSPIIDKVSEEGIENLKVGKVNVDENGSLAEKYGIMSIPTIIIFKNGNPVKKFVGVVDIEEIKNAVKSVLMAM